MNMVRKKSNQQLKHTENKLVRGSSHRFASSTLKFKKIPLKNQNTMKVPETGNGFIATRESNSTFGSSYKKDLSWNSIRDRSTSKILLYLLL
jgi:hypothetical protein